MKFLSNVTLVNINCVDAKTSVKALNFSSKKISFNDVILFSDKKPSNITNNINFIEIPKIDTFQKYNEFVLRELVNYIKTDYCLVIQNDGFIINPHLWRDEFLDYDYIGAPWDKNGMRVWKRTNRIGNGGFSLRSKKLMEFIKNFKFIDYDTAEDVITSLIIEKHNFKYPSVELAVKFSLECPLEDFPFDLNNSFGFHGKLIYNHLNKLLPQIF